MKWTSKQRHFISLLALLLFFAAAFYVGIELKSSYYRLQEDLVRPDIRFWGGIGLVSIAYLIYPLVWWLMLRGCGAEVPLKRAIPIWWVTNMGKYIPGKVWFIAGRVWVGRRWGAALIVESFVWELMVGISSALVAGSFLLIADGTPTGWRLLIFAAAISSLIPLLHPALAQRILRRPLQWFGGAEWSDEVRMHRRRLLGALALMTCTWILWGFAFELLAASVGLKVEAVTMVGIYSLAWAFGMSMIVLPAGLGAREGAMTFLSTPFLVAGAGALLALLSRVVSIGLELALFGLGLLLSGGIGDTEEE